MTSINKNYIDKLFRLNDEIKKINASIEETQKVAYLLALKLVEESGLDVTYKSTFADLKAMIVERIGYSKIKKKIIEEGLYKSTEIVFTTEQLIKKKGKAKVLIGSIKYDETIPSACLKNLEMICSDADFSLLQDSSLICNLTTVLGHLSMCELNSPIKLLFTGDYADLTKVSNYYYLPNYKYALGKVVTSQLSDALDLKYIKGTIDVVGGIDVLTSYKDMNFSVVYYLNENTYQKKIKTDYKEKRKQIQ